MAKQGQLTAAWEILSTVVMLRAKAKEQKLGRLLSSLHGVEVELARIIAAGDEPGDAGRTTTTAQIMEEATLGKSQKTIPGSRQPALVDMSEGKPNPSRRRQDGQLDAYCRRYLALAEQLKQLMVRGEIAACGRLDAVDGSLDDQADAFLMEQHDLSLQIARLKATNFRGLAKKAAVLDDLAEENSDDPVQALARSLARDVVSLHQESKVAS